MYEGGESRTNTVHVAMTAGLSSFIIEQYNAYIAKNEEVKLSTLLKGIEEEYGTYQRIQNKQISRFA
jgi:hypothetical protein